MSLEITLMRTAGILQNLTTTGHGVILFLTNILKEL